MRRRNAGASARSTDSPSIRTSPLSGSISRLMLLSSVVLPDPDPPTRATNTPSLTVTLASRTAKLFPPSNDLLKVSISISAPDINLRSWAHVYSVLSYAANAGPSNHSSPECDRVNRIHWGYHVAPNAQ